MVRSEPMQCPSVVKFLYIRYTIVHFSLQIWTVTLKGQMQQLQLAECCKFCKSNALHASWLTFPTACHNCRDPLAVKIEGLQIGNSEYSKQGTSVILMSYWLGAGHITECQPWSDLLKLWYDYVYLGKPQNRTGKPQDYLLVLLLKGRLDMWSTGVDLLTRRASACYVIRANNKWFGEDVVLGKHAHQQIDCSHMLRVGHVWLRTKGHSITNSPKSNRKVDMNAKYSCFSIYEFPSVLTCQLMSNLTLWTWWWITVEKACQHLKIRQAAEGFNLVWG